MFNKSIAYRLSIYISLAVIGVFVAFILITYFFNSRNLKKNIENRAVGISSEVITNVEKQLIATREITANVAEQIIFYAQHNHPDEFIRGLMEKYPFINAIRVNIDSGVPELNYHNYFSFRDTNRIEFEQSNEEHFHCSNEKLIFEEVSESDEPRWTDVFQCPRNQKHVVSFYSPILQKMNTNKIGEVFCEVSLNNLNDSINNIKVGEKGYAFILSKDGVFVTHPIDEMVLTENVYSVSDDVYNKNKTDIEAVLKKGLSGSLIFNSTSFGNVKHWGYYTRLKEIEWTLVVAIPYAELFGPLYMALLQMLFFSVLGILIVYVIITYITNKLIEPLSTVTSQLKKFSSLTGEEEINSLNEVTQVSESLNYLKSWYEKYKVDVNLEDKRKRLRMQDLNQASEIQQSLIKTGVAKFPGRNDIDLFALYKPAKVVSGDLFDYFFIDEDNLLFTMGDVSGKGIPAALFMSVAQTIVKSNASYKSPRNIVKRVNRELYTTNQHQFFLTLFLGILNMKTGVLVFCNAAHSPSFILKPTGEIVELSESHGLPLGLYPNKKYSESKITLEAGDSILLYTDGVTDLLNEKKIQFGNEKFIENLRQLTNTNPRHMVDRIEQSLELYKGEAVQVDDITLMAIKYQAQKKPV